MGFHSVGSQRMRDVELVSEGWLISKNGEGKRDNISGLRTVRTPGGYMTEPRDQGVKSPPQY
jgi:hypothetical protein